MAGPRSIDVRGRGLVRPGVAWMCVVLGAASCGQVDDVVSVPLVDASASVSRTTEPHFSPSGVESSDDRSETSTPDDRTVASTTAVDEILVPASTTTPPTTTTIPPATSTTVPVTAVRAPDPVPTASEPPVDVAAPPLPDPVGDVVFTSTVAVFDRLAQDNPGASLTVVRGGGTVVGVATGTTVDGSAATSDSPMVVASVGKVLVAVAIARLHQVGAIDVDAEVPWTDIGLSPAPGWETVTVRQLLDHRSGMPKARSSWFTGEGTCRDHVPSLLATPPGSHRGRWVYSNGNYCVLGLLVEQRTTLRLDEAVQTLVFDPVGVDGVHLTDDGLLPGDQRHVADVSRFSRLGGAGTLVVSTDDTATVLSRLTDGDRAVLQPPGVFTDQYGWGHTGTVDGAKSCVWVLEAGRTVVSATIAGTSVRSGGALCDLVVPAVATDIGLGAGPPVRDP